MKLGWKTNANLCLWLANGSYLMHSINHTRRIGTTFSNNTPRRSTVPFKPAAELALMELLGDATFLHAYVKGK